MALSRDVVIRLLGDADSAVKAQKAAADAAGVTAAQYRRAEREYDRSQKAMEAASRKQRAAMEDVGRASMIAGGAIVAGLGLATKAAMEWESSWTGVLKTVNGSPAQLAKLEAGLRGLTRVLPSTHTEIAAVAEAAGQLGVKTDSILEFTRVMVDLGETTNLSADEAATSLAQMMNVMRTAPGDVDRLGSTLVALGNAGASTEADIMDMAQRLAGAGQLIGASESDVMALASSMADMGIQAELGGGAMSRVMLKIYSAMQEGGDAAKGFADLAGMSAQDFAAKWQSSPVEAIDALVQGLGRVKESGGNVVQTLGDLGIEGTQNLQVMLSLAGAGDQLTDSLGTANRGWEENTALLQEAAKRYDTTAAKTEMARNAINDAAIEIGDVFLPVLASLAESVADVAGWLADLPQPLQNVLAGFAGVAGVAGLAGGAFLLLAPRVMETYKAFQLLNTGTGLLAGKLGALGKAAGVATALAILGTAVSALDEAMAPAPAGMQSYVDSLLGLDNGIAGLNKRFAELDGGLATDLNGFADAIKRVTDPSNEERLNDFGGALFNVATFGGAGTGEGAASRRRVLEEINGLDQALAFMVQNGNGELAAKQFQVMADEAQRNGVSVKDLTELFPLYADELKGTDNDQKAAAESARLQAEQAKVLAGNLDFAYGSIVGYAAALGLSEDATKDMVEQSNALGESLGAFIDPLGTYTGLLQAKAQAEADAANKTAEKTGAQSKSWEDFVGNVKVSFAEYLAELEKQVADQTNWQTNMLMLAGRVSAGTLAELSRMGPEGAPLVADLVTKSDAELDKMDGLFALRSKEATDAWGAQLTMAQPVLAEIARKGGQGASDAAAQALQNGTKTLAQIAAQWGVSIAGGINPILSSLGKPRITTSGWDATGFMGPVQLGGFMGPTQKPRWSGGYTGDGGKYEPKGIVHGGEYVLTKEQTSRLGIGRIESFANNGYAAGGFVSTSSVPKPPSTAPFQAPYSTVADAAMQKVYDETTAWLGSVLAPPMPVGGGGPAGAGVQRWLPLVLRALGMVGEPAGLAQTVLRRMQQESGGNPMAINNWDINAKRGTPSKGLMQTIDPTFRAYAMPGYNSNVYDPLSNILASMRYAKARYGSLSAAYNKAGGYANGGTTPAGEPFWVGEQGPELMWSSRQQYVSSTARSQEFAGPGIAVGSARSTAVAPTVVEVNIDGAVLEGTFEIGGDGLGRIVNGRIASALTATSSRKRYNP